MPKYTPTDEEMGAYGNETPAPAAKQPPPSVDEENSTRAEILISKDELPEGCKVGDTYTFRVQKDYGDEVSLALESESPEETSTEEPMSMEAKELSALSEEGE